MMLAIPAAGAAGLVLSKGMNHLIGDLGRKINESDECKNTALKVSIAALVLFSMITFMASIFALTIPPVILLAEGLLTFCPPLVFDVASIALIVFLRLQEEAIQGALASCMEPFIDWMEFSNFEAISAF